jgi:hypothetical protein
MFLLQSSNESLLVDDLTPGNVGNVCTFGIALV